MHPHNERELMAAARTDIQAFTPVYERYFPRIFAYCRRRVNTLTEAEDLTSRIFTKALTHLHTYRGGNVGAWLFAIAHNTLVNHYRSRRPSVSLDDIDIAADSPEPLEHIVAAEETALLNQAVAKLPPEQQDILMLKLVGQLSSAEIGEIIGKKPGAVRVEIHRIMQQLRRLYLVEETIDHE